MAKTCYIEIDGIGMLIGMTAILDLCEERGIQVDQLGSVLSGDGSTNEKLKFVVDLAYYGALANHAYKSLSGPEPTQRKISAAMDVEGIDVAMSKIMEAFGSGMGVAVGNPSEEKKS